MLRVEWRWLSSPGPLSLCSRLWAPTVQTPPAWGRSQCARSTQQSRAPPQHLSTFLLSAHTRRDLPARVGSLRTVEEFDTIQILTRISVRKRSPTRASWGRRRGVRPSRWSSCSLLIRPDRPVHFTARRRHTGRSVCLSVTECFSFMWRVFITSFIWRQKVQVQSVRTGYWHLDDTWMTPGVCVRVQLLSYHLMKQSKNSLSFATFRNHITAFSLHQQLQHDMKSGPENCSRLINTFRNSLREAAISDRTCGDNNLKEQSVVFFQSVWFICLNK